MAAPVLLDGRSFLGPLVRLHTFFLGVAGRRPSKTIPPRPRVTPMREGTPREQ